MPRFYSVEDILSDIEFEIAQGVVARDELGEAVQAVRQFQNKARTEAFASLKLTDPRRAILSRQFQIVDMLLNLLQQMALNMQALQLAVERIRPLLLHTSSASGSAAGAARPDQAGASVAPVMDEMNLFPPPDEIEKAMRPDAIHVEYQARPFRIPLIGTLLNRLRNFYQRPAQFYTQLFSDRQAPVNRVLGDRILYLENIVREQQQQLQALSAQRQSQTQSGGESEGAAKM